TSALPPVPVAPSNLQFSSVSSSSVNLSWSDNSNNEDNFEVYKSIGNNTSYVKVGTLGANSNTFTDNSLFAHTTYFYKVLSRNVRGASVYSNEIQFQSSNTPPVLNNISDVKIRYDDEHSIPLVAVDNDNDLIIL